MSRITGIDVNESMRRKKLVFREDWFDRLDRLMVYLSFSLLIIYPALIIPGVDFNTPDGKFVSLIILPLVAISGLYVIYRKAAEKKLSKIITPFDREKNRQMLINFAEEREFEVYRKSDNCLIFNEYIGIDNPNYKKSMVFLLKDNLVLFTILKSQYRLNMPVLTSHLFLKYDLKKIFQE